MAEKRLRRGDHVSWNSEAGRVRGRITRVTTTRIRFKVTPFMPARMMVADTSEREPRVVARAPAADLFHFSEWTHRHVAGTADLRSNMPCYVFQHLLR